MKRINWNRWLIVATATTLFTIVVILAGCSHKGKTQPVSSSIPTEIKMAELPLDPQTELSDTTNMSAQNLQFTGNNTFTEVDNNGDGLFEALQVNVEVQTSASGEYTIFGVLEKGGTNIADRPTFESMLFTAATFTNGAATHNVDLAFSGEQIFRSGQDGPYDLFLLGVGPNNESAEGTFPTPAIDHTLYGEVSAVLTGATASAVDTDNDGDFDFIKVAVDIDVRIGGDFSLQGDLSKKNVSIVEAGSASNLGAGMHTVDLQFPGSELRRSGQDGPYSGTVNLLDATGHTLQSLSFATQSYASGSFND
jgi:hypothetical protein